MDKARVMLVEDHPVVLRGLANLIDDEEDLAVCGGAGSVEEALRLVARLNPDVVVADLALGKDSGMDFIKKMNEAWPAIPILVLSMHDESLYAERAIRAGAKGYVMKSEPMDEVMSAIRRILIGEIVVSRTMSSRLLRKLMDRTGAETTRSGLESLSDREFEIFNLIAQSIGPSEIAHRLGVSVKTVETYRERIKEKLGVTSGGELTRVAIEWLIKQQ